MPAKRGVKSVRKGQGERRSGRQSDKGVKYTYDSDLSESGDDIHVEIDKLIDNIPVEKSPPKDKKKGKGRKSDKNGQQVLLDDDDPVVLLEKLPAEKSGGKNKNVRSSLGQQKKKLHEPEQSDEENGEGTESETEKMPVKKSGGKNKNIRTPVRQQKRKQHRSELSDEESGQGENSDTEEQPPAKKLKKKVTKPVKVAKKKSSMATDNDDNGDQCLVCSRPAKSKLNGVWSCNLCQKFFQHHQSKHSKKLVCRKDSSCGLDSSKFLIICPLCRYNKCMELGMADDQDDSDEGERKSSRIQNLEKNYNDESSDEEEDIYSPPAKRNKRPNYYESSDEDYIDSSASEVDDDDPEDYSWTPHKKRTTMEDFYKQKKKKREVQSPCIICGNVSVPDNAFGISACKRCIRTYRKALNNIYIPRCATITKKCDVNTNCGFCRTSRYLDLSMKSDRFKNESSYREKAKSLEKLLQSTVFEPEDRGPCTICGFESATLKNGAVCCKSCVGFFTNWVRKAANRRRFKCLKNESCKLDRQKNPDIFERKTKGVPDYCMYCRYKKCVEVGMKKGVQGRRAVDG